MLGGLDCSIDQFKKGLALGGGAAWTALRELAHAHYIQRGRRAGASDGGDKELINTQDGRPHDNVISKKIYNICSLMKVTSLD